MMASSKFFERSSTCAKPRSVSRRWRSAVVVMRLNAPLFASSACFNSCVLFTRSKWRSLRPSKRFLISWRRSLMLMCAMLVSDNACCNCRHRASKSSWRRCWSDISDAMDLCPASSRFVIVRVASWSFSREACFSAASQMSSWARWRSPLVRNRSPSTVEMFRSWNPILCVAESAFSCASLSPCAWKAAVSSRSESRFTMGARMLIMALCTRLAMDPAPSPGFCDSCGPSSDSCPVMLAAMLAAMVLASPLYPILDEASGAGRATPSSAARQRRGDRRPTVRSRLRPKMA
mmetsp:Transcript_92075/g.257365  ORF Transcript_92075/g.257365 Transcript_92075/m.257365 type:complete len:290 (+) Transcript_92075:886-1755(+)